MKIQELIECLQKLDQEANVFLHDITYDQLFEIVDVRTCGPAILIQFEFEEAQEPEEDWLT